MLSAWIRLLPVTRSFVGNIRDRVRMFVVLRSFELAADERGQGLARAETAITPDAHRKPDTPTLFLLL